MRPYYYVAKIYFAIILRPRGPRKLRTQISIARVYHVGRTL